VRLLPSNAKISQFPEYQHLYQRNFTVWTCLTNNS
jgi:hypothetical protein